MKPERVKAKGTFAARSALKRLGDQPDLEALGNEVLQLLSGEEMTDEEIRLALDSAVKSISHAKRKMY